MREFTGVWEKNSKNGKRIFEGDIVAVPCDRRGNEYIGVVEFGEMPNGDDRYMGFYIKWDNPNIVGSVRCSMLWWRDTKDRYLKVIGNKWDNPELLKEKEPMLCTGDYCNKKDKCARYFRNADMSEPCQVESFASFGSGPAYIGKNGSHIIEDEVWCGPNGHYKMYKGDQQL